MKALRSHAPEGVLLAEVELRTRSRSTCGTDVRTVDDGHQNLNPPRIIGDTEEP